MSLTQTTAQTLEQLKQQEQALNSNRVQTYWQQQSSDLANQFFQQQRNLMSERVTLENVELQKLAETMNSFEPDLLAGCANLSKEIDALDNAIALLNTLSHITSVVGQIIHLVA
jgi:uncharacterized protein YPO0396